ncbi:hypothetical protein K1719_030107 [Acacia pycnantha]|nr:hypothetical protein K1719_030107 [Acacia pycnantha]
MPVRIRGHASPIQQFVIAVAYTNSAPHHTVAFLSFWSSLPFFSRIYEYGAKPCLSSRDLPVFCFLLKFSLLLLLRLPLLRVLSETAQAFPF